MKVSIQLLFLFNERKDKIATQRNSFNTASVLIQRDRGEDHCERSKFQYSFCSYSTSGHCRTAVYTRVSIQLLFLFNPMESLKIGIRLLVSIQLLFLFNESESAERVRKLRFQYSFCSYSTKILYKI